MSNSYNTQDTEFFPNTKVFTGVVLQHRRKILLLPFPSYHNKKKYAKYEIKRFVIVLFYSACLSCEYRMILKALQNMQIVHKCIIS